MSHATVSLALKDHPEFKDPLQAQRRNAHNKSGSNVTTESQTQAQRRKPRDKSGSNVGTESVALVDNISDIFLATVFFLD
jgi:hypothetical protein